MALGLRVWVEDHSDPPRIEDARAVVLVHLHVVHPLHQPGVGWVVQERFRRGVQE